MQAQIWTKKDEDLFLTMARRRCQAAGVCSASHSSDYIIIIVFISSKQLHYVENARFHFNGSSKTKLVKQIERCAISAEFHCPVPFLLESITLVEIILVFRVSNNHVMPPVQNGA